ncbi:dTDP-4-dehydrorhamnose reductase [Pseudooceanicola algae]|uniref:dTDP-4-dehydrorhamnose reductase n=1 Tax=Pseudooceanicola algae TaxID=1537215 RepID=A0A418SKV0_9RHOB|nr:dTDP-4-dehydrorhamnose reductase [Pseudooceanicola algae]QPM90957.1 dTDP-4-dehydrorhamnose reductase [Pseudooceanicola algae]
MKILVFGKNGQVGRELTKMPHVLALDRSVADLSVPGACARAIAEAEPDLVINAAAFTAVDKAEAEVRLAQRINGEAPGEMARACAALGRPFLHVSSDYVFDGSGRAARRETARCKPINTYGHSKLEGEEAVIAAAGRWGILRTSWVFSAHGQNFVRTILRLSDTRAELQVVEDQIGGPTPAADIARALMCIGRAMVGGHPGGLYHFSGQPPTSWAGFAREVFARTGRQVSVTGIASSGYPTPAARPLNSRLDCRKIAEDFGLRAPDWKAGLDKVLAEMEGVTT